MASCRFGDMLRIEREKRGLVIEQVVAALRIRKKFLIAFEEGDYLSMPPSGYAQNMIVAYARFLGLDANLVLDMFFSEYEVFSNAFKETQGINVDIRRHSALLQSSVSGSTSRPSARSDVFPPSQNEQSNSRNSFSATQHTSRYENAPKRQGERRLPRSSSNYPAPSSTRQSSSSNNRVRTANPQRQQAKPASSYAEQGKGSYNTFKDKPKSRIKLIIAIIGMALLVVAALVIWAIVSNPQPKVDTTTPVTGVTTTSSSSQEQTSSTGSGTQSGGVDLTTGATIPFNISIEVPEGKTTALEVTIDGKGAYSGTAVGPFSQSYYVTQSITISAAIADNVIIKKDDATIPMNVTDGAGVLSLGSPS